MENELPPPPPPPPPPPESPKQKFVPIWTLLIAIVLMTVAVLGGVGYWIYSMRNKDKIIQHLQEEADIHKKKNDVERTMGVEQAKVTVAQNRQQEVLAQLKNATNNLTQLLTSVIRINAQAVALKTNSAGQAIAQSIDLVGQARRIYEAELFNLATKDEVVTRLEGARRAQQQIEANLGTAYNPDADLAVTAQNTALWAEQSLQKCAALESYLANLVQNAQAKISERPITPSSPTLAEAIDQLNAAESGRRLQTIANNTIAAKGVAVDTVADAEAKRIIEEAKLEAAKILREANLRVASNTVEESKNSVAVQQIQDEALKIKLREKASRPDIQSQLAAYLTPGYYSPSRGGEQTGYEKKPMSYSKLREMGALDPSLDGLRALVTIGVSVRNDRPRLPRTFLGGWWNNPAQMDQAKSMQQLIIELGPTFVDMGLMEK